MRQKDDDNRRRDDRYNAPPPQTQNSRFARAAELDRDREGDDNRDSYYSNRRRDRDYNRGPPPMQQNSRFAMAAEADRSDYRANPSQPPRVQNSRFAAAARDFQEERASMPREHNRGPPPVQNSRFAAAAEADMEDRKAYEEARAERMRERGLDPDQGRSGGNSRWGNVAREDNGRYGGGSRGGGRYGRGNRYNDDAPLPRYPGDRGEEPALPRFPGDRGGGSSRMKKEEPKNELFMKKKVAEKVILPPTSAPLTLPGEDEEAARARIEKKKRDEEERKKREEEEAKAQAEAKAKEEQRLKEEAEKAMNVEGDILDEFASCKRKGDDLTKWVAEQKELKVLPSVEKLLFHYLVEVEANNPDKDCSWAKKDQLGAAFLSLVSDDVLGQVQILWAIQRFCDKNGFPKMGDEYLIQTMFTNMYKYDLAEAEAFDYWKEDESDEHEAGKQKTLVQTIDWFNWLEEDDDEEYEDEEYEY